MSVKFDIPDNYLDYRQYFSIDEERSFDMLIAYIETWHTYQVIWDNNWISKEWVRQCLNATVKKLKIIQNTMFREGMEVKRQTMSDTDIIAEFHTSWSKINRQCWTRTENWIGKVARSRVITKKMNEGNDRWLKSDNWEYPKPTDYELSWMKEAEDLNRPHPVLYTKIL